MKRYGIRTCVVVCFATLVSLVAADAEAQRVRVRDGGVRVRAPFVRVDVGPSGGVSVRAPFAAVDVPPNDYFYPGPGGRPPGAERRIVRRELPDAIVLGAMSDEELQHTIVQLSRQLHEDLRKFDTGATWQRYFRLPEAVVDRSVLPSARIEAMTTLLERFYKIADDPKYSMIARVPSFVAMQEALNQAVARYEDGRGPYDPMERGPFPSEPEPTPVLPPQDPRPEAAGEELPMPAPQRPAEPSRDQSFLKPRS